jgi:hypothetical protein
MDSMNLWFLLTFHYFPFLSPVGMINAASHRSFPTFNSTRLHRFVLIFPFLLFPLVSIFSWPYIHRVCIPIVHTPSPLGALYLCWYHLISCNFFFYCTVTFQVVGGRISLYNFRRLSLSIPLSSVPAKSFNYIAPPSMTGFTLYGPNQYILSFPG